MYIYIYVSKHSCKSATLPSPCKIFEMKTNRSQLLHCRLPENPTALVWSSQEFARFLTGFFIWASCSLESQGANFLPTSKNRNSEKLEMFLTCNYGKLGNYGTFKRSIYVYIYILTQYCQLPVFFQRISSIQFKTTALNCVTQLKMFSLVGNPPSSRMNCILRFL